MSRRLPKFPLEMANGEKVRSIEKLRENADIDSIVKYFLDGRLRRWCSVFGYADLPEKLENATCELIKNIYDVLEIPINEQEIKDYLAENHDFSAENIAFNNDVEEDIAADNQDIKSKLTGYVDTDVQLSDYSIEVIPVSDEDGKICKYKIIIDNEKTEQYTRFVLPYSITTSYTKERFEVDMYRKISNSLRELKENIVYNNSCFSTLKVGEMFLMGRYEGKPIKWKVIFKNKNELYVISADTLCERQFDSCSSDWFESDLRRWLNGEFYNSSFTLAEKKFITQKVGTCRVSYSSEDYKKYNLFIEDYSNMIREVAIWEEVESDHIGILSHNEGRAFEHYDNSLLPNGTTWVYEGAWNRGQYNINGKKCGFLCTQENERFNCGRPSYLPNKFFGIRPVFWLKY